MAGGCPRRDPAPGDPASPHPPLDAHATSDAVRPHSRVSSRHAPAPPPLFGPVPRPMDGHAVLRAAAPRSLAVTRIAVIACAFYPTEAGRKLSSSYRASDGVRPEWLDYCQRWRTPSTSAQTPREPVYYRILKCGRWLAAKHPEVV